MLDTLAIFAVLIVVTGVSIAIFFLETRRWTTRRRWVAMSDWAEANDFRICREHGTDDLVALLGRSGVQVQRVPLALTLSGSSDVAIVQAETEGKDGAVLRWNLLVRKIGRAWPPTALRPSGAATSIVDTLPLTAYPSLISADRFVIYGSDTAAARMLAETRALGLLPPDTGLLLAGDQLLLDFSNRPFDGIEFGRMRALAKQLAASV